MKWILGEGATPPSDNSPGFSVMRLSKDASKLPTPLHGPALPIDSDPVLEFWNFFPYPNPPFYPLPFLDSTLDSFRVLRPHTESYPAGLWRIKVLSPAPTSEAVLEPWEIRIENTATGLRGTALWDRSRSMPDVRTEDQRLAVPLTHVERRGESRLDFRLVHPAFGQMWFRGKIVAGVIKGRVAMVPMGQSFDGWTASGWRAFKHLFSGYHLPSINAQQTGTWAYELAIDMEPLDPMDPRVPRKFLATLWIDTPPILGFQRPIQRARLKVYAQAGENSQGLSEPFFGGGRTGIPFQSNAPDADPWLPECRRPRTGDRRWGEIEYDLRDALWNDNILSFNRVGPDWRETWTAQIAEYRIQGTVTRTVGNNQLHGTFRGERARVLSYGLSSRTDSSRQHWQERVRRQIDCLTQGEVQITAARMCQTRERVPTGGNLVPQVRWLPGLDPSYQVSEIHFEFDLGFHDIPSDSPPLPAPWRAIRRAHGWLAVPNQVTLGDQKKLAIVFHGHFASGFVCLYPGIEAHSRIGFRGATETQDGCRLVSLTERVERRDYDHAVGEYNYGDILARQGYYVLSLDVSHRGFRRKSTGLPDEPGLQIGSAEAREELLRDIIRASPYEQIYRGAHENNADGCNGNILQPPIMPDALVPWAEEQDGPRTWASDWSEFGERVFTVRKVLDAVLQGGVDGETVLGSLLGPRGERLNLRDASVSVVGLSLGGEMATMAAAMDTRYELTLTQGFCADSGTLYVNSHECSHWDLADFRDYIDISDLHALVAPRVYILGTQAIDYTVSPWAKVFRADGQVVRTGDLVDGRPVPRDWLNRLQQRVQGAPAVSFEAMRSTRTGLLGVGVPRAGFTDYEPTMFSYSFAADREVVRRGMVAFRTARSRYQHVVHTFVGGSWRAFHTFYTGEVAPGAESVDMILDPQNLRPAELLVDHAMGAVAPTLFLSSPGAATVLWQHLPDLGPPRPRERWGVAEFFSWLDELRMGRT